MTRYRLRPAYTPEELRKVYARPYDHTRWKDHESRVKYTAALLRRMKPSSVADLSCGDGAVTRDLDCLKILGDITPGWEWEGPIEETVRFIRPVDVFVLSETLEHLDDPDEVLRLIRLKAERLLLTTPARENNALNPEHLWSWDVPDVQEMLAAAGWKDCTVQEFTPQGPQYYIFQIWRCS